jgi:hypothetical protein
MRCEEYGRQADERAQGSRADHVLDADDVDDDERDEPYVDA